MGDLSTHEKIFSQVARPVLTGAMGLSGSLAQCFELGNWLRDVSQFRDPYAFASLKTPSYDAALVELPRFGRGAGGPLIAALLDEIFGPDPRYDRTPDIVTGALGEWFRNMMAALGAYMFCSPHARALGRFLPEADYANLFDKFYTQYFPHEHLDFPPSGDPARLGDWSQTSSRSQGAAGGTRRVLAYLDDFIGYVATQFTASEIDLRNLLAQRPTPANRISPQAWNGQMEVALVRLGKASHAVEDFFFHSNFAEAAFLWRAVGARTDGLELRQFFAVPGVGRLPEGDKRRLYRRQRAPRLALDKKGDSVLDKAGSEPALAIFTGMFGGEDLLYTFADALEGVDTYVAAADAVRQLGGAPGGSIVDELKALNSTLIDHIFDPKLRKELVTRRNGLAVRDNQKIGEVTKTHIAQVRDGTLAAKGEEFGRAKGLGPLFGESIRRAADIDLRLAAGTKNLEDWCVGRVLLREIADVEAGAQNRAAAIAARDQAPRDAYYLASDNGVPAENVGSHALMAKDSVREQPLRKQADAFARYAVQTAMRLMAQRTAPSVRDNKCVDWGELLRRLLCHPAQAPGNWAIKMLTGQSVSPSVFAPKLIARADADQLVLSGNRATGALEASYRKLRDDAEAAWRTHAR